MILILAVLAIAFGCGKRSPMGKEDSNLRGLVLGPVLADPALSELQPESSAVGLGGYDEAFKARGRDQYWLVNYTWFFLPYRPIEFKNFAEMHQLEKEGKIDSTTVVSTISYRMGIEAKDIEHLRKRSTELKPKVPPPALVNAVNEYVATHRVSARDTTVTKTN